MTSISQTTIKSIFNHLKTHRKNSCLCYFQIGNDTTMDLYRYCEYLLLSGQCTVPVYILIKSLQADKVNYPFSLFISHMIFEKCCVVEYPTVLLLSGIREAVQCVRDVVCTVTHDVLADIDSRQWTAVIQSLIASVNSPFSEHYPKSYAEMVKNLISTHNLCVSDRSYEMKSDYYIIYHPIIGFNISDVSYTINCVVMDIPHIETSVKNSKQYLNLLLFTDNLEYPEANTEGIAVGNVGMIEKDYYLMCAERIASSKVNVIACQKRVHPLLHDFLEERGIIVISRISGRFISYVQSLSGAIPLGTLPSELVSTNFLLPKKCFGIIGSVQNIFHCHKPFVAIYGISDTTQLEDIGVSAVNRRHVVSSVFVAGLTECICFDAEMILKRVLEVVRDALWSKDVNSVPIIALSSRIWQVTAVDNIRNEVTRLRPCGSSSGGHVAGMSIVADALHSYVDLLTPVAESVIRKPKPLEYDLQCVLLKSLHVIENCIETLLTTDECIVVEDENL